MSNGVTPFQQSVYNLCSQVPKGKVTTYGRIAKALKSSPRAGILSFSNVLTISWQCLASKPLRTFRSMPSSHRK